MTILLRNPYLVNVTTKGEGVKNIQKNLPRGLWMTLYCRCSFCVILSFLSLGKCDYINRSLFAFNAMRSTHKIPSLKHHKNRKSFDFI